MAYIGRTPTGSILTGADIADGSISTAKIADTAISTAKIADDAVTNAKTAFNDIPFRNIIINGDMSIAQRGTSATGLTGSGYHTIDRYRTNFSGTLGTWTQSQDTDVPSGQGFGKSMKMDCTTADASPSAGDRLHIRQNFEGQMLQHLKKGTSSAESVTLSFWVKSNKTGTYITHLVDQDNTRSISKSYTINSASTWEKKTITFEGDTTGTLDNDNGQSLYIDWYLGAGTNFTSGTLGTSWSSTTNANIAVGQVNLADNTANEWYITGVQLEVGTSASDFEFLPFDVNLQRCQRYYYAHEDNVARVGRQLSNTECGYDLPFPNIMRTTPTVTYNSPSNDLVQVNGNNQSPTGYDSARSSFGTKSAFLALDYSSNSGGNNVSCKVILSHSATSKKEFDAEL